MFVDLVHLKCWHKFGCIYPKKTTFTVKNDDNKQVCQFTISVIQMKHQLSTWEWLLLLVWRHSGSVDAK